MRLKYPHVVDMKITMSRENLDFIRNYNTFETYVDVDLLTVSGPGVDTVSVTNMRMRPRGQSTVGLHASYLHEGHQKSYCSHFDRQLRLPFATASHTVVHGLAKHPLQTRLQRLQRQPDGEIILCHFRDATQSESFKGMPRKS